MILKFGWLFFPFNVTFSAVFDALWDFKGWPLMETNYTWGNQSSTSQLIVESETPWWSEPGCPHRVPHLSCFFSKRKMPPCGLVLGLGFSFFNPNVMHFPYGRADSTRKTDGALLGIRLSPLRFSSVAVSSSGGPFPLPPVSNQRLSHPSSLKRSVPCSCRARTLEGPIHSNVFMKKTKETLL